MFHKVGVQPCKKDAYLHVDVPVIREVVCSAQSCSEVQIAAVYSICDLEIDSLQNIHDLPNSAPVCQYAFDRQKLFI
jgi:hypothetical protein